MADPEIRAPGANNFPAAMLKSQDGESYFSLNTLRWETPLLPCTRYDEWLVCEITLNHLNSQVRLTGACLLRYELEEIYQAFNAVNTPNLSIFCSDFLEPVLKLKVEPLEQDGSILIGLTLSPRQEDEVTVGNQHPFEAVFTANKSDCKQFADALETQLDGFLSLL